MRALFVGSQDVLRLAQLDSTNVGLAMLMAIVATAVAGLYPTWRAVQAILLRIESFLTEVSSMQFALVWVALRRRKVGAILIAVQIAVTLAVLCNALFIIEQRLSMSTRPTGVREADLLIVPTSGSATHPIYPPGYAPMSQPCAQYPASRTRTSPIARPSRTMGQHSDECAPGPTGAHRHVGGLLHRRTGLAHVGVEADGAELQIEEITDLDPTKPLHAPPVVIVTRALAERLFPGGKALGQNIIILPGSSTQIIGVVDRLQVPWVNAAGWGSTFSENSALLPFRLVAAAVHVRHQTRPGANVRCHAVSTENAAPVGS